MHNLDYIFCVAPPPQRNTQLTYKIYSFELESNNNCNKFPRFHNYKQWYRRVKSYTNLRRSNNKDILTIIHKLPQNIKLPTEPIDLPIIKETIQKVQNALDS